MIAAAAVALWGVAHVLPTRNVLTGFEPVTVDNRRVLLQEWLAEAFAMWGTAALVVVATVVGGAGSDVTAWVYRAAAGSCSRWPCSPPRPGPSPRSSGSRSASLC